MAVPYGLITRERFERMGVYNYPPVINMVCMAEQRNAAEIPQEEYQQKAARYFSSHISDSTK
jgi:hypothetical protein